MILLQAAIAAGFILMVVSFGLFIGGTPTLTYIIIEKNKAYNNYSNLKKIAYTFVVFCASCLIIGTGFYLFIALLDFVFGPTLN